MSYPFGHVTLETIIAPERMAATMSAPLPPQGVASGGGKPLPGANPTPPPADTTDTLPPPLLGGFV